MKKEYAYFNKDGYLAYLASALDSTETREHVDVTDVAHKFNFKKENGDLIWKEWEIKEEPIVPAYNLEEEKQKKINILHTKFQENYIAFLSQYPGGEVDSFKIKREEALAYKKDPTTITTVIDGITKGNKAYKKEYIKSVLAKVDYLAGKEGDMLEVREKIKACKTKEELEAINV